MPNDQESPILLGRMGDFVWFSGKIRVGNAVPGVPTAEGGGSVRFSGAALAHRTRRNAGDGVPYGQKIVGTPLPGYPFLH